jgi:hypothetical protein
LDAGDPGSLERERCVVFERRDRGERAHNNPIHFHRPDGRKKKEKKVGRTRFVYCLKSARNPIYRNISTECVGSNERASVDRFRANNM